MGNVTTISSERFDKPRHRAECACYWCRKWSAANPLPLEVAPVNPYQSPVLEDFKDEGTKQYEQAIEAHEGLVNELRAQIRDLEAVNWGLIRQLMGIPVVVGYHMEGADIDG